VLATVKGAALGGLLALLVVGGLHTASPSAHPAGSEEPDAYRSAVQRAVADHHCSYTGLPDGAIPSSALIRTTHGQLRRVSFDVGWDVYTGRRPGTLVAVCAEEPSGIVQVHD
jgi:hypothetical protein